MPGYVLTRSTDLAPQPVDMEGARDVTVRWLVDRARGATTFAMRLFEVQPGGYSPRHSHAGEHEVYVLEGSGVVLLGDRELPAGPGTFAFIPAWEEHQFKNPGDGILRFLCVVPVGETTCAAPMDAGR